MHRLISAVLFLPLALALSAQWSAAGLTIAASSRIGEVHHAPSSAQRGTAPYNDECQNAVVQALPFGGSVTVTGDNTGSTDTEEFGNPNCWEAFSIDTCSTVTVSYCGTDPLFTLVYSILIVGCPDFIANVQNNGISECPDGNMDIVYQNLPAGTYYVPVLLRVGNAEGPYTITITSSPCDLPPLNDRCADAALVPVVVDCAQGVVAGSNANTVIDGTPPCATTTSQFQDVWYQFNSGENTSVTIAVDPGTIGDLGVEVRAACPGPSIYCAIGDTAYTVPVEPMTNYRVRVFSNNDFGFGGTFDICITEPPGVCDGGTVTVSGGGTSVIACSNGGDPIDVVYSSAGAGALALVLTTAGDTIVQVLTDAQLDPSGLPPGEYHVWGISFDGELTDAVPGWPLGAITSTGSCVEVSNAPVVVQVEICQLISNAGSHDVPWSISYSPEGPAVRWMGGTARIDIDVFDMRGALLNRSTRQVVAGNSIAVRSLVDLAPGVYLIRVGEFGGLLATSFVVLR